MRLLAVILIIVAQLLLGAPAGAEERLTLPGSFEPQQAVASIDQEGQIVLRMRIPEYGPARVKGEQDKREKTQAIDGVIWREMTYRLDPRTVEVVGP